MKSSRHLRHVLSWMSVLAVIAIVGGLAPATATNDTDLAGDARVI